MQDDKPDGKTPSHGLLIGSYRYPAAGQSSKTNTCATPHNAAQSLSPMQSRPSTVMSANYRYASTLATEASSTCSEPESAAESASEMTPPEVHRPKPSRDAGSGAHADATGHGRQASVRAEAKAFLGKRLVAVSERAGSVSRKAGLLKRKAGSEAGRAASPCTGLQAQLREQHPFKPLTAAVQPGRALHHNRPLQQRLSQAPVQCQRGLSPSSWQMQPQSFLEEEEANLLASLQRLDTQLGTPTEYNSTLSHVTQSGRQSELGVEARQDHSTVDQQSASTMLPTLAKDSRVYKMPSTVQKPVKDSTKPNAKGARTEGGQTGNPRAAGADRQTCPASMPAEKGSGSAVKGRVKGRGTQQSPLPNGKAIAGDRGGLGVKNAAEQKLLQSSLARLDTRLSSLAAKCGGKPISASSSHHCTLHT